MVNDNDWIIFAMRKREIAILISACAAVYLHAPVKYRMWNLEEIETELNDIINDAGLIEHV